MSNEGSMSRKEPCRIAREATQICGMNLGTRFIIYCFSGIIGGDGDPRVAGGKPAGPTFRDAADAVIAMHEPSWRGPKSGQVWRSSLDAYVLPVIGDLPVAEVTPGHVMSVLQPIWSDKRETARRVKQRISAICRWAVAEGHRTKIRPAS